MSNSAVDPAHRRCDVCGKPLNESEDSEIRVLEVPFHAIEDLRKIDESIADELLRNDGRLTYHSECEHPIHRYLPGKSGEVTLVRGDRQDPVDNLVSCPVCNIPVLKSIGECGRCGKELDV